MQVPKKSTRSEPMYITKYGQILCKPCTDPSDHRTTRIRLGFAERMCERCDIWFNTTEALVSGLELMVRLLDRAGLEKQQVVLETIASTANELAKRGKVHRGRLEYLVNNGL